MKEKIFKILKNKYIIASLAFIIWVGFVDSDHNFFRQGKLEKDLQDLSKLKIYYEEQIKFNKTLANKLDTDIEFIEKFAREKYEMKKDNEVVYSIVPN